MSPRRIDLAANLAALAAGALLSLMVHLNGELARQGGALFSSWMAHGTGTIAALLAIPLWWKAIQRSDAPRQAIPLWAYLGGFAGAVTVIMTSTAVNSALALSGTVALGLAGQIVFSLAADQWGLFGIARRRLRLGDAIALALIVAGSALVIWGSL
jgi:transporter family-2 protein